MCQGSFIHLQFWLRFLMRFSSSDECERVYPGETLALIIDYRSYQMSHCVSIPMIFVSAIFARLSRQMTRATLTAKMALTTYLLRMPYSP
jgi:hypothetical protein